MEKKNAMFCILLQKKRNILTFFYVLCKRMKHSLRSFTFLQKNVGFSAFF